MDKVLIYVVSLGCVKNQIDTEHMLGILAHSNAALTQDPQSADIIIVNTCGFIGDAKQESIDTILEMAQYQGKLIVTGCLSQRYADELSEELPEVDVFLGVSSYSKINEAIKMALEGKKCFCIDRIDEELVERVLTTPPHIAYVKIAEGCDNRCSYCAIPYIRGPLKSRDMDSILSEIEDLRDGGVKEIILIAQDTTKYGTDLGKPMIAQLVDRAAEIMKDGWVRLLYCYPEGITDELVAVMQKHDNVCKYMDIPIQHFSDSVLKRMNRRNTKESSKRIVKKLREKGFTIRTTLIVGFPGETKEDFDEMLEAVKELRFERLGVFRYSNEDGTPAEKLPGQLSEEIKRQRYNEIMALQEGISQQICEDSIGKTQRAIVDGFDEETGLIIGRTMGQAPDVDGITYISTKNMLEAGSFVDVVIEKAYEYDLLGEAK